MASQFTARKGADIIKEMQKRWETLLKQLEALKAQAKAITDAERAKYHARRRS